MNDLRRIRKAQGLTIKDLADRIGVTEVTMSRYEREENRLTLPLLRRLASELGVSIAQLCGESELAPPAHGDSLPAYTGNLKSQILEIDKVEYASIPRYDAALSAGPGSLFDHEPEPLGYHMIEAQWLRTMTRAAPDRVGIVQVDGDSMEDTLLDGDWVVTDFTQRRLNRQGIYALRVFDALWIKRISLNLAAGLVQIISDNPHYPMQELPEENLQCLGRVVGLVSRKF